MPYFKQYRFIFEIHELTPAEKTILSDMFTQANGFGGKVYFKFKYVPFSAKVQTNAKAKLLKLNIIQKLDAAFVYKIQEREDWLIKDLPTAAKCKQFDKYQIWLYLTNLTTIQKKVFTRITNSMRRGKKEVRKKQNDLAKELDVSKKTIGRVIKQLVSMRLLEKKHTGTEMAKYLPASYSVAPFKYWNKEIVDSIPKKMQRHLKKKYKI